MCHSIAPYRIRKRLICCCQPPAADGLVVVHNLYPSEEACAKRWGEPVCLAFAEKWCSGAPARTAARSLVADALALAGQIRRFKANCREVRHSVAVEPVIGDHKDGCLMRRNYFKGRDGDRIDALPAAGGFNFRPLLAPFAKLSRALLLILSRGFPSPRPCVPHGFPGKSPH